MAQKIISQAALNAPQVHAELNRIKARDGELGFRAQKALDYFESLGTLDAKNAKELFDALAKLEVPRLRDVHFHKIIDLMPISAKDVKTVLAGYQVTVSAESCKKIADAVAQFAK